MALTISSLKRDVAGNVRMHSGLITFDSSYATGGEDLTPEMLGLHTISDISVKAANGWIFEYDFSARKLKAFSQGAVTGATAVSGTTGALMLTDAGVEGTARLQSSAISSTYKWGPLLEVSSTTNLSTVAARFIAIGT